MGHRNIIVVGASAGGVEALTGFVAHLPADLNAAVLIVLHIPAHASSTLNDILSGAGPLPAKFATDHEPIESGTIYIAPTNLHLVIEDGRIRLTRGPRENRVRPCIDVLFRSAALEYGNRVIGIVLSGTLDDGTAGLWAIKDRHGITIVQDPNQAQWSSMPESALNNVQIDHVLPVEEMGKMLTSLTVEKLPEAVEDHARPNMELEIQIAIEGNALKSGVVDMGKISSNTCPECRSVLVKISEGSITRFRCHTGHAFSLQTLLVDVDDSIDYSLWDAIRAIEECALILREMEHLARKHNRNEDAEKYERQAVQAEQRAQKVRDLVVNPNQ